MAKAVPIVGTVVGAVIGSIIPGVGTALGASIGGAIGGIGAALLASPATIRQQVQYRGGDRDPHPKRRFFCGRARSGLAEVFRHVDGEMLYQTHLIASEPIEDFEEWWLYGDTHLEPLTDSASRTAYDMTSEGARLDGIFGLPLGNYDRGQVEGWIGLGDQTQFPQEWIDNIAADVPDISSASWKGRAVWHQQAEFGDPHDAGRRWRGRFPVVELVVKGGKRYDPNKDSTLSSLGGSGSHTRADSSTWEWTRNAAANALHILRARDGLGRANRQILIDDWMAAITDCGATASYSATLNDEGWTGSEPALRVAESDPGSGVWTYSAGAVALATGVQGGTTGLNVCRLFSTDTDGTLDNAELGKMGVYIDVTQNSLSAAVDYLVSSLDILSGETGVDKWRVRVYQADRITSSTDGDDVGATAAEQLDTFMPPDALSSSITLLDDTGYQLIGAAEDSKFTDVSFEGDYLSVVIEGGGPNEDYIEIGPRSISASKEEILFAADGLVVVDSRETDFLGGLVAAMGGFLSPSNGKMGVRAGVWKAPTDTLSKALVRDFKWTGRSEPTVDCVIASYIDEQQGWQESETRKVLCECAGRKTLADSSYTLVIGDASQHVRMTTASATVTVPPQSSVAWSAFDRLVIEFVEGGSVSAGAGVTITAPDGLTASQGEFIRVIRNAEDDWRAEITTMDRVEPLDLPMVSSRRQATQLAKIRARRLWFNRTVEGWWSGSEYKHRVGDTVTYNRTDLPIVNGDYMVEAENVQDVEAPGGGMMMLKWMRLREDAEAIYDFDPDTEFDPLPVKASSSSYTNLDAILSLDCYQEDYLNDGVAVARLVGEATISTTALSTVQVEFEWQYDGDATWTHLDTVTLTLSESTTATAKLDPASEGVTYNLRARAIHDELGNAEWVECGPTTITAPTAIARVQEDGTARRLEVSGVQRITE